MWGLYSSSSAYLPPLKYTSGKTQEDVVDEILEQFDDHRIVIFKGAVGSGKSVVGAHVSGLLGRGIISVPTIPLQEQYHADYEKNKEIILDGRKLAIRVIKGRKNFPCRLTGCSCKKCLSRGRVMADCIHLPCTVSIREGKLGYRAIGIPVGLLAEDGLTRKAVAEHCDFWSPVTVKMEYRFHGGTACNL